MIFYFSATGNSLWTAKQLGEHFKLPLISVTKALKTGSYQYDVSGSSLILFVFPVHSWGPALSMYSFIERLKINGYKHQPIYAICTCGDDCGETNKVMNKIFHKKGLSLSDTFSITMPNSYILLPGFDVDSKEIEKQKLDKAPRRLSEIIKAIENGNKSKDLYYAGSAAGLKTRLVYSLFKNFIRGKTKFKINNKCISCGLCIKICPEDNIIMKNNKPEWGNQCVQCTACMHRCPVQAIECGRLTRQKGRYKNPNIY